MVARRLQQGGGGVQLAWMAGELGRTSAMEDRCRGGASRGGDRDKRPCKHRRRGGAAWTQGEWTMRKLNFALPLV